METIRCNLTLLDTVSAAHLHQILQCRQSGFNLQPVASISVIHAKDNRD